MSTLATTNIKHPSSASNNIVLDASGNVVLQAGSASTPALQPSGDTNTGIFFPAADTIAFAEGGVESARIDSSGRLLVGTSSESGNSLFTVRGNTGSATGAGVLDIGLGTTRPGGAGTPLGYLRFTSTSNTGGNYHYASITAETDGTSSSDTDIPGRLVFSTTADGASSPTQNMLIRSDGGLYTGLSSVSPYNNTTASAANVVVTSGGYLGRSTSSIKYKTGVETLRDEYADAILNCRPVYYRSLCAEDNANWGWWGFIAEEVAKIDPRLVHWKTIQRIVDDKGKSEDVPLEIPEPEGVQYDRFVPHLLNLIKRQKEQIESMEARLTALEIA